jgi:hypothetical protein
MTLPSIVLGFVISTLYGAGFHLWRGGSAGRLILYLVFSWIGFWIGNTIATLLDLGFGQIGPLNLLVASIFSLLALGIGHWLSMVDTGRK